MIKPYLEKNGILYQVQVPIENQEVVVDICYSGNRDENGNDIVEFEYTTIRPSVDLSLEEQNSLFKFLENGIEEDIVRFLVDHYKGTSINFSPNEYQF